jgi:tetratricopeptide (TPR) repeat protein
MMGIVSALGLGITLFAAAATPPAAPTATDAVRLYDQGRYEDARHALTALDAKGALNGPLLYRLYFCALVAHDGTAAQGALDRARQALEKENPTASSLEVPFYLANAYVNMGRPSEARDVAARATAKIETGAWRVPEDFMAYFQLAKLYQDQAKEDEAVAAYRHALQRFDPKDGRYSGNARWALRYLGSAAFTRDDFAGSERAFSQLTALGDAPAADWNALAAARARLANWTGASQAWKESVKADPENADDPRYSGKLADAAAALAPLPAGPAGGTPFKAMSQEALESFLKKEAEAVRALHTDAAAATKPAAEGGPPRALAPGVRAGYEKDLRSLRALFVGAGIEYAARRLPIRETAFHEGYAVLIFQDSEWTVAPDPVAGGAAKP